MTESYYPRHSPELLQVMADDPIPLQDVPRLTKEVLAQREVISKLEARNSQLRNLLADICGALEASSIPTQMEREFIVLIHEVLDV